MQNQRNVGKLIPQGKCIDCGQDWSMYESEIAFYRGLMATKKFTFPKRCRACREKKRKENHGNVFRQIVDEIQDLAEMLESGDFHSDPDRLAAQLRTLATNLDVEYKKLMPKNFSPKAKGSRNEENSDSTV